MRKSLKTRLEQNPGSDSCFGTYERMICANPRAIRRIYCGFEKECATATMLLKGAGVDPSEEQDDGGEQAAIDSQERGISRCEQDYTGEYRRGH